MMNHRPPSPAQLRPVGAILRRTLSIVWAGTYLKPTRRADPYLCVLYDGHCWDSHPNGSPRD
jgi:hypothetical protein